jgi:hypothetical protein
LFSISIQGTGGEPVLVTDRGFIVQKDITAGGFVGSNQGELWLGSGRHDQVDVPKVILMRSDVSRLNGGGALNVPAVPTLSYYPAQENGRLFVYTANYHLYKYVTGTGWVDKGPASDYSGYFDTLYLTKVDAETPANMNLGKLTSTSGALLNAIAIGNAHYGSLTWPYESIQLASNHNLRIYFATTEKYVFANNGTFTVNNGNIMPQTANVGNIGSNTLYWGSIWGNYVRYKNLSSFDALDDLALAKNYKIKTITEEGVQKEVVDHESLPFLKAEGEEPFFDLGKTNGFLLGCIKALVLRVEKLEAEVKGMAA